MILIFTQNLCINCILCPSESIIPIFISGNGFLEVEMKDIFSRFTNDSIASTAFGVKINSLQNKFNKFYVMGKKATNFSGIQYFKFFAYSSFPYIMKVF